MNDQADNSTPAENTYNRKKTDFQALALLLENGVFLGGVLVLCRWGWKPVGHPTPGFFVLGESLICLFSLIAVLSTLFTEFTADEFGGWLDAPYQYVRTRIRPATSRSARLIHSGRGRVYPTDMTLKLATVVVLTSLNTVPFAFLVAGTGGVKESPFTPLITVPALFSAFQARKPRTPFLLACIGSVAFLATTWYGGAQMHHSLPNGTDVVVTPKTLVFACIGIGIMLGAGILSAASKARDQGISVASVVTGSGGDNTPTDADEPLEESETPLILPNNPATDLK